MFSSIIIFFEYFYDTDVPNYKIKMITFSAFSLIGNEREILLCYLFFLTKFIIHKNIRFCNSNDDLIYYLLYKAVY